MIQNCQDALAINHHFHGADLFITITANPNCPEITRELLPGQSASDHPDLVVCVFHAKVTQLLKDLEKHGEVYLTCILFSFWLLNTSFELLKILTHSFLLSFQMSRNSLSSELVKKFMVHNPCGTQNPQSPCMDGIKQLSVMTLMLTFRGEMMGSNI